MTDAHIHVRLLPGHGRDGKPVHEMTPARLVEANEYVVLGTPGLANGCAAGDRVRVEESGAFEVVERGPNVAVHFYLPDHMPEIDLVALRSAFTALSAIVEWPAQPRFVVVTVPVDAGFAAIEAIVRDWITAHPDVEWNYGNVYDDDGQPLGWWA